jgi:hypothetical protein
MSLYPRASSIGMAIAIPQSMTPFARTFFNHILLIAAPVLVGCSHAENRVECVPQVSGGACRIKTDPELLSEIVYDDCAEGIDTVNELVSHDGTLCCYDVTFDPDLKSPCDGRPLRDGNRVIVASVEHTAGWSLNEQFSNLTELSPEQRNALRDAWTSFALAEHASIASFARATLDLLAVGAPASLVSAAQSAALDEVHHAQMCFTLASAYANAPVGPGPLPLTTPPPNPSLSTIAAETVRDGCVNETLAALLASNRVARAKDPQVRSVLAIIAEDEMRHALLAWQTVRWALDIGGPEVRIAVEKAFAQALRAPVDSPKSEQIDDAVLADHGVFSAAEVQSVIAMGLKQVLRPSVEALLSIGMTSSTQSRCSPSVLDTTAMMSVNG